MKTNTNEHSDTFHDVCLSLAELMGTAYIDSVAAACAWLENVSQDSLINIGREEVQFYPRDMQEDLASRLKHVGEQVVQPLSDVCFQGAASGSFHKATHTEAAPLSARGYYRVGEDGRLYLAAKSEHYHASVGHRFPGYRLLDHARLLGIPNATHNNTRGAITRFLERELIRTANGLPRGDAAGLDSVLSRSKDLQVLNRVLNLETGSLVMEAALKMMLARFYRVSPEMNKPRYHGRTPVILVVGNDDGGLQANYHGTTILTQVMRGMWPGLHDNLEVSRAWKIVAVRPNRQEDLDAAFEEYEGGPYKIAGFFHEIIMMNYGGLRLTKDFLIHAHSLCDRYDVPTAVDEIQSCMWSSKLYLFREYGLKPTFVGIGKGFPGGEYPASRLLFSAAMDCLPQFGALVTNGQEELASLAYLVTMEWVSANGAVIEKMGSYYHQRLCDLAEAFPGLIEGVEGWNHMTSLRFRDLEQAKRFAAALNARCVDVSAQTYKPDCPPVLLTKLPVTVDRPVINWLVDRMREALMEIVSETSTTGELT